MDFSTGGFLIGGFINLGGPPVFKLHFFLGGSGGWLILGVLLILTWHYQTTTQNQIIPNPYIYTHDYI